MSVEFAPAAFTSLHMLPNRSLTRRDWPTMPTAPREPIISAETLARSVANAQSSRPFSREDRLKLFLNANCMEKFDIPLSTIANTFVCNFPSCKKNFEKKRQLLEHWRVSHPSTKPYMCKFSGCNKSFLRPAHLMIHERIHTGEKPYVCEYEGCGKRWSQKSALTQHLRSHTGEKPFLCEYEGCAKRFSTSSSCKRHMTIHSGDKKSSASCSSSSASLDPLSPNSYSSSPVSSPPQSPIHYSHNDSTSFPFTEESEADINKRMALTFIMN